MLSSVLLISTGGRDYPDFAWEVKNTGFLGRKVTDRKKAKIGRAHV
jgi:hypothetical protein